MVVRGGCNGGRIANSGGDQNKTKCEVCFKGGHGTAECWHRFNPDYVPDVKNASAAMHNYGVNSN
jgi:dienelactone hydrolase